MTAHQGMAVCAMGATIEFSHEQSARKLPAGTYRAVDVPTPLRLGANGRGTRWRFVEITDGPLRGERVYIQEPENGETESGVS